MLDQTAFYPRGGGQEPDKGKLDNYEVVEVLKQADLVLHKLKTTESDLIEGKIIHGEVDAKSVVRSQSIIVLLTCLIALQETLLAHGCGKTLRLKRKITEGWTSHTPFRPK